MTSEPNAPIELIAPGPACTINQAVCALGDGARHAIFGILPKQPTQDEDRAFRLEMIGLFIRQFVKAGTRASRMRVVAVLRALADEMEREP